MLAILSPAKKLDYDSPLATEKFSEPGLVKESKELMTTLRKLAPQDISSLMGLSDKLAQLNYDRFQSWQAKFDADHARPAILAFKGDVYIGLDGPSLSERDFSWAQNHLRILSGLHGILRPLDRIRPYRLEMGTKLQTKRGKSLYEFWGNKVTDELNQAIAEHNHKAVINLASKEYFSVLQPGQINARLIDVQFKEFKNGQYKNLSFFAKKARGLMSRYMIDHRVNSLNQLQAFDYAGYQFNDGLSKDDQWVFTRNSA